MTTNEAIKVLGVVGAILSFIWGVFQWREKALDDQAIRKIDADRLVVTRRIEATKPFLERQLILYTEATKVAAQVATEGRSRSGSVARTRFWELYWGELAMVENPAVEGAMIKMGTAISSGASAEELQQAALGIAHACRHSLDNSWGINAWSRPDEAASGASRGP